MTVANDFRDRAKLELGFTGVSTERGFSDAELAGHVQRAVEEYSVFVPLRLRGTHALAGGVRDLDWRTGAGLTRPMKVVAIEYPLDQQPRRFLEWDSYGDTLTLFSVPSAGYTVRLYYEAYHLVDGSGSTVPVEHEGLLVEGIVAKALLARAVGSADTWDVTTATVVPGTYQHVRIAQQRYASWQRQLEAIGRKLRAGQLYAGTGGVVSKSIVGAPG